MTQLEINDAIARNLPLPSSLTSTGNLDLWGYAHPLPSSLTSTGNLDLEGYAHPLPSSLTSTGYLYLRGYAHPLPSSLTSTGALDLGGYAHPLPSSLLDTFRADLFAVLDQAAGEVEGLLGAIRAGQIDGSTYSGSCRCLVGTLEKTGQVALPHDSERPAERWFLAIRPGDTPATNPAAAQAERWVVEWMADASALAH